MLALCAAAGQAFETTTTVTRTDGRTETVRLQEARFESPTDYGFRGRVADQAVQYKIDDIWRLDFGREPFPFQAPEQIWFTDGTRLSGTLARDDGANDPDAARTDLFRTLFVKRQALAGISRLTPAPTQLPAALPGRDVLWTADGDRMVGRLVRIEPHAVSFRSELGSTVCPRSRLRALILSPAEAPAAAPPEGRWVLTFVNGDRVFTPRWQIQEGGKLECALGDSRLLTELRLLERAVYLGPRARIFSRLQPARFAMAPRLEGTQAIIVDRAPEDRALRVGAREYLFGLFLRPDCEMEYALEEGARHWLAEIGLSSELARDGSARVLFAVGDADWQPRALNVKDKPEAIALDLNGARRLRIKIESDSLWGVGAHVIVGEPVLIHQ